MSKLYPQPTRFSKEPYLNYVLSERGFPFKPGEKTIDILNKVLTKFSTSQAFYFILFILQQKAQVISTN